MICLPRVGSTAVRFPANNSHTCCVELALKGLTSSLTDGYAMLMSPRQGETAVHGCHCPRDMALRMREVMARPWIGVCVPLALIFT